MGVHKVRRRRLRRVIRMGVIEAHDLQSVLTRLALHSHHLSGINFVALVRLVKLKVATRDHCFYMPFVRNNFSQENPAAFVRVGFLRISP